MINTPRLATQIPRIPSLIQQISKGTFYPPAHKTGSSASLKSVPEADATTKADMLGRAVLNQANPHTPLPTTLQNIPPTPQQNSPQSHSTLQKGIARLYAGNAHGEFGQPQETQNPTPPPIPVTPEDDNDDQTNPPLSAEQTDQPTTAEKKSGKRSHSDFETTQKNNHASKKARMEGAESSENISPYLFNEIITVQGKKYKIETQLPPGTSKEQAEAFKTAFRDHVLKEIFKEIKSPTRPFTITFSKENGFSVTTHEPPKETSKNLLKNKDDQVRKFDFSNPGQEKTLEANKAIQQILFLSTGSKANFHLQQNSLSLSWKTLSNSILSNATIEAQQKPLPHSSSQKTSNRVISTQNCEKPRGIPQTDNNCWASTMLQLLLISEPSRQWLEEHKSEREEKLKALHTFYQKVTGRQSLTSQDVSNIRKMATTLLHPEQNESTESNAQGFLSLIQNVASNVFGSQQNESTQEDLEEGLSAILEAILPKQYTNETIIYENSTQKQVSVIERKNPECVSDSILKLKIPTDSKNPDVKQLLDFYFTQNKKQIGERYIQNEQTNNVKYDATKAKTKYAQCPSELWLSIGRWKSDLSKNQVSVDIQREITITDERGNTQTYRLNGIGHHQGNSQNSGHYVSDIRKGNQWFRCDGTQVTESSAYSKEIIPSKTAYILHYEKVISQEIN